MNIERRSDETQLQYHKRLVYGKLVDKTLQLLEDEQISDISDESLMSEIDDKIATLKKEQQKFYDQRREYSKILSQEARSEHLLSELRDSAKKLSDTVGNLYKNNVPNFSESDTEAVLVLSD